MALDATIGGAAANSFVTLAEANAYFGDALGGEVWLTFSESDRNKALVSACRQLSRFKFRGTRETASQALPWPRLLQWDEQSEQIYNRMPSEIKEANFEEALSLLQQGSAGQETRQQLQQQGVLKFQAGNLSEEFAAGAVSFGAPALTSARAQALLLPFIRQTAQRTPVPNGWVVNRAYND